MLDSVDHSASRSAHGLHDGALSGCNCALIPGFPSLEQSYGHAAALQPKIDTSMTALFLATSQPENPYDDG
jgi:hypothetical protein